MFRFREPMLQIEKYSWKYNEVLQLGRCFNCTVPGRTETGAIIRKLFANLDRIRPVINVTVWNVLPRPISSPEIVFAKKNRKEAYKSR